MAEVVDSIIAQLEVRLGNYVTGFEQATKAHREFTESVPKVSGLGISVQEAEQYANRHAKAANDVAASEEQATARVATTRRRRSEEEVAADKVTKESAKASAKERSDAAKTAAKAEADAQKEAAKAAADRVKAEQDYQTALARVREGEIQSARRQREELKRLRDAEAQSDSQVRVSSFLTPLGSKGLSGQSARSSADAFRDQFKAEAAEAKEAAAAEVVLAKARDAAGLAAERATAREAQRDANSARRTYGNLGGLERADPATSRIGRTVRSGPTGQSSIPASVMAGAEDVAAEAEIDRLKVDQISQQAALNTLKGAEKRETQDNLAAMRLERQLRAENVVEEEILLRVETLRGAQATRNALEAKAAASKGGARNLEQFARGSGFYAATGGAAAIAGIGTAAAVYGGVEAVGSSIAFAKQISDVAATTGVSTKAIQVYQAAARQAGATNEQLSSSFGRLNDYVGRAKEGDEQAAKTFNVLGISLKGVKSAGDVLPTLVDRLSQIKDPSERAAVGTRLFGEEYRRLDAVLGQGTGKIDALAASMQRTGSILSGRDIATLKDASAVLAELKARLEVDLARVVAGNAQAILGLANAFANLADKALKAVQAIGRIKAQNIIDGNNPGTASAADTAAARQTLIADGQGRQFLLQRNAQALARNRQQSAEVGGSTALMNVGGRQLTGAQFYAEQRRQLLASRREVLNYRDPGDITTPVTPGKTGDVSGLFAPKPPKGPKGPARRTPDQLAAEQAERDRQYLDRLAGLQETELRAREALTGSIAEQAKIESDLADRALKKQLDDIELTRQRNVAKIDGEHTSEANKKAATTLENAHAAELVAAAKAADASQRQVTAQETSVKLVNAANQHLQTQLSIDAEIINTQASLATTRKERLALELKALDNQKQQEKLNLQTQLATLKPGDPARDDVQKRLGSLDTVYAGKAEQTRQGSLSPLDAYRRQLKGAVGDTNDALQQVEVNGLGKLDDQIASTIGKVLGLKGAFGELAESILTDLAKIAVEKGILSLLGLAGGGLASSGDIASLSSSAQGNITGALSGFRASGGGVVGGSTYLVGEHGPELFTAAQSGRIVPNNSAIAAPGVGSVTQHITIDARNSVVPAEFASQILDVADQRSRQHAAQAGQLAVNAAPSRVTRVKTLGS